MTEDICGHHAERWPVDDLIAKRTLTIAQHDPVLGFLDDEEVTLDPPLQIDQDFGDLFAGQVFHGQRLLVEAVDLLADRGSNYADISGRVVKTYDLLQRAGELADQASSKAIAFERNPNPRTRVRSHLVLVWCI